MALSADSLDGFLPLLATSDTKNKLTIAANLIAYLAEPDNDIECADIGQVVDGLIPWMQSSNNKVSQCGIDALTYLVDRLGPDFRPYIPTVITPIIDRLGDSKEVVREKAQLLLLRLAEREVLSPQSLLERLTPAFSHKNGKIREESLHCLQATLAEHGAAQLGASRLVPHVVRLLADPQAPVRDAAFATLLELYRHVGERLRMDLQRKHAVPASKMPALMARFDELRQAGELLPSALAADGPRSACDDEPDCSRGAAAGPLGGPAGSASSSSSGSSSGSTSAAKRANSVPRRPAAGSASTAAAGGQRGGLASAGSAGGGGADSSSRVRRTGSLRRATSSASSSAGGGPAGAVDEDAFQRAFVDVPPITLFSTRELEEHLATVRDTVGDSTKDWGKRVDAMKRLRALVLAVGPGSGAAPALEEALLNGLRPLEPPFQSCVRDLRSQVVREACVTVAFLAEQLRGRADHFAESLLPALIQLIPNSAKVMASAGAVSIRFILRHTHAPRLLPVITRELVASKSRDIRRACCEFLELALSGWATTSLERHCAALQEALRRGISDADPEARLCARKAYWAFRSHFPDQADQLLNSLDATYRRALNGEQALSNSSSSNSLHHHTCGGGGGSRFVSAGALPRLRMPGSAQGSTENLQQSGAAAAAGGGPALHRTPSLTRQHRSGIPVLAHKPGGDIADGGSPQRRGPGAAGTGVGLRSSSAIDLQAAQRAKARSQYAAMARHKVGSGASLRDEHRPAARPRKTSDAGLSSGAAAAGASVTSPERVGRTRARVAGVSQSQPTSRSGSPSSRLSYATYAARMEAAHAAGDAARRGRSGIPRSTGASRDASRETSPNRYGPSSFGSKLRGRPLTSMGSTERPPSARPVMAQKILQQSREAESALADALNFDTMDSGDYARGPPMRKRLFDDHSDDSETSSVCSERSFDSFRRPSDSFSWSGSQQRLFRESLDCSFRDIGEVIANCASTHWADRKEGLVGLQAFLQSGQLLAAPELRRVTEIFTKMFMDSHTKVFSLFLDTLWELLQAHRADLTDWLYVLLTRLLNKLGTDLLGSIHTKIQRLLVLVRESFPAELQLAAVFRFLVDGTQTPNARVRAAVLTYLTQLCVGRAEPSAVPTRDPALAALARIIMLTSDSKSAEVRRAASAALTALFNLSTAHVTMLLADLPPEYQEAAAPILQSQVRRSSGPGTGAGGSPPSPGPGSPGNPLGPRGVNSVPAPAEDDLNPEEVYRSLRRTTAEIQSYSFGDSVGGCGGPGAGPGGGKLPDRDRDTTSQDSGISQMSTGGGDRADGLEEQLEGLSLTRNNSGRSSSLSSPTHRLNSLHEYNGLDSATDTSLSHTENGYISREGSAEDAEALRKALETLRMPENLTGGDFPVPEAAWCSMLMSLQRLIRECGHTVVAEHFKVLLRVLLELLGRPEVPRRDLVLAVLAELLRRRSLAPSFQKYVELLVLKVLEACRDPSKEVMRMAEVCGGAMSTVLPPDTVIRVLNPLITTGDFPVNLGAIKMLMKVVEAQPREALESHLAEVMPALIKAYNNEESSVRKSAVFCMVALHSALGEGALQPHLTGLCGSKLKLLHLYIRRAQTGGGSGPPGSAPPGDGPSAPTSPKGQPPTA